MNGWGARGGKAEFPNNRSLEKMLAGSLRGTWHWHHSTTLAVVSIPRWLQLAYFRATQAELECVAPIHLPAGSVTEARRGGGGKGGFQLLCIAYCLCLAEAPASRFYTSLRLCWELIVSKSEGAESIPTEYLRQQKGCSCCPVWLYCPRRITGPATGKRWGEVKR
jgi:hypothetical protein